MKADERENAEKIRRAALDLLEEPGIQLDHDEICRFKLGSRTQCLTIQL
ncbi:MAG: hypothetical protein JRJ29_09525 [Deltaproteobacteria bacterium]|nr:hypothetical protein [Deltaproteobacteria bacterium]